jgi:hypothetical protein
VGTPLSATDRKAMAQRAIELLEAVGRCADDQARFILIAQAHVYALLAQ